MDRQTINLVGLFLIIGAAIGFTYGMVAADLGSAAIFGAIGAALGIVLGAVASSLRRGPTSQ
jgi:hypothetical protein